MERIIKEAAAEATKISVKLGQVIAEASQAVQTNVISFGVEQVENDTNQILNKLSSKVIQILKRLIRML